MTPIAYIKTIWNGKLIPPAMATDLNHAETGIKAATDVLDAETDAGRAMVEAADAAAQRALLNVEDGADVTDLALASAIEAGTATTTPNDTDKLGVVKEDHSLLYYTIANLAAWVKSKLGPLTYDSASKDTPAEADSLPLSDSADTNATKKLLISNLFARIKVKLGAWIYDSNSKITPIDADSVLLSDSADSNSTKKLLVSNLKAWVKSVLGPVVFDSNSKVTPIDADSVLLSDSADTNATKKLLISNIWAWVIGKIEGGAATATPADTDIVPSISAAHAAQKSTWANLKAAIKTALGITYTSGTLTIDGSANSVNIPTANEKTRLSDIQAATGATTAAKLAALTAAATSSAQGVAQLATSAEVTAGTDASKIITSAALAAGFPHIKQLADAEVASALGSYNVAFKMPHGLLGRIVQDASGDRAAVLFDDLGFPSMMFKLKGPLLAGHLHADMGSVTALKTAVIAAAGSGYTANDVLTIVGGTGGTVRVLTVDGSGAVTSIVIVNPGTGYSATTGAATTGGTGTLCTITTTIAPVHPAFCVNGVDKLLIYYGMYKGTSFNGTTYHGSGAGYRSVCWPGLLPTASLDFDVSKALHTAKGAGWHMTSMWERGLVNWLSMKLGTEPRGNTYYGRSHESGYEFEYASRADALSPGNTSGVAKHYNGSGWDSWAHNGKQWGIHDLSGSLWEWQDGFKEVDGLLYMPLDNYFALAEASWPSMGVYLDNTVVTTGGAPRLSNARDNALVDPNSTAVTHNALTMTAGYDGLDLAVRQRMLMAGIAPKIISGGTNPWSPKGTLYNRNYGERLPLCGGSWSDGSLAGLAALNLSDPRSSVATRIGFRPSYIAP